MRLFVPLLSAEFERLLQIAQSERRSPQNQAALIIARVVMPESTAQPSMVDAAAGSREHGGRDE